MGLCVFMCVCQRETCVKAQPWCCVEMEHHITLSTTVQPQWKQEEVTTVFPPIVAVLPYSLEEKWRQGCLGSLVGCNSTEPPSNPWSMGKAFKTIATLFTGKLTSLTITLNSYIETDAEHMLTLLKECISPPLIN